MILPNKYVTLTESYIGISALILETIADKKLTIDKLWSKFQRKYILSKKMNTYPTYQKFIYILEFMYLCSMISYTSSHGN
ncbi:hypothetical protein KPL37_19190 [Clostridium frigoris]|uniref:Beta-lactamase n=1 Tax=Clostridium frigoris TaxID=205327 RepID=A0ABS6BZ04_9CLOT|nr:ABC-three component system middle component 6 [Clostridium frigoris]MBU3161811.1 hypothetical protein [Clostridium frigoris]